MDEITEPIEQQALTIIDENQQRIMQRDGSKIYPITVPLRKKLEIINEKENQEETKK